MISPISPPDSFRWRPLRIRRNGWPRDDAGPLSVTEADGVRRWINFGWRRYISAPEDPRAAGTTISMPYPTAACGALTPTAWTAGWRACPSSLKRGLFALADAVSMLPWLAPAIAALTDSAVSGMILAAGLALSGLLLRQAAGLAALDCDRASSVGIHGRVWDRLLALPSGLYDRAPTRLVADIDQAITGAVELARVRRLIVAPAIALAVALILLAGISTIVTAVAAIGLAVFAAMIWWLAGRRIRTSRRAAIAAAAFDREVGFVAQHLPRLRDLGVLQTRKAQLDGLAGAACEAAGDADRAEHAGRAAQRLGLVLSAVAVLALIPLFPAGMTPRDILTVLLLTPVAAAATAALAAALGKRPEALQSIFAIDDLLQAEIEPDRGASDEIQTVSLKSVGYRHDAGPEVLRDINLTLRRGEVIALSGGSGAGKSTLLRIVMGLVDPSAGDVCVNGRRLRAAHAGSFRTRIAGVFQNEDLGFSTVRNAVSAGRTGVSLDEIQQALAEVGLLNDVLSLPMGLQTLVIAGAFPLSFCHRLMIARSLAAGADLLVFDETLTDLDPAIAREILDAARRRGAAVIFSTHKPALLGFADRVIRLPPRTQPGVDETTISETQ
jgi:ABC-type bacteriocin/lantibiotic exporter with double-glycine peptidase domain